MQISEKDFLIKVKADIDQALADLKKLPNTIEKAGKASAKASKNVDGMGKSVQFLTRAAAAYLSIKTVVSLVKQADAFNVLNVRIKTATKDTGDYVQVQRELFRITQQNGADFATTVSLFQGLARTAPELKASNTEILKLVNSVQQLGVISGASQAAQRAGLLQFSQGLAGGVFRAEEFNSILENLPEVASRLAKGMNVTVGELRKMVIDGKLLSKDVFDALLKQSEDINAEFKDIPESVARSATTLSSSFSRLLTLIDNAADGTGVIAKSFQLITESLDNYSERLAETDLDELVRKRQEAGQRYFELLDHGASKESLAIKEILAQIDKLDTRIISLNKQKLFADEASLEFVGPKKVKLDVEKLKFSQEEIDQQKDLAKAEKSRINSLQKLNASIVEQGALYGKTAEDIAVYKLQQLGASEESIKFAKATFATIRAQKQLNETTTEGTRVFNETRTEMELLAAELTRLNKLYEDGAFGAVGSAEALDTLARATFDAEDKLNGFADTGEDTFAELTAATRGWGDQFTNTLADMVTQGKLDFSSLADSIINDLLRIAIQQQVTGPLLGAIGVPGFEAFVNHSGGFAGTGPKRTVNPLVFAGAKRYHNGGFPGLRSDEVPTILQTGEAVLSRKQVAAGRRNSGGGVSRIEMINRGSPSKVQDVQITPDINGDVIRIIIDDIDRGGQVRDRIKTVSAE